MSAFSEQLWNLPANLHESMLHGVVCGLLCGSPDQSVETHRRALTDLLDAASRMDQGELETFIQLAADDLASPDLAFAPLLPYDDYALADRVEGLAQWSDGFLTAFEEVAGELEGDALDALEDIGRIADVESDLEDDEGSEFDYSSVVEHLKVAVLLIHDEMHREEEEEEADDDSE